MPDEIRGESIHAFVVLKDICRMPEVVHFKIQKHQLKI
jgi:acyl-coenzyme A synthetase/AMP-(fatty) acid ligase